MQLQQRFRSTLRPPEVACTWPKAVLKRWYEDGGRLTLQSAEAIDDDNEPNMIQYVGVGASVHELEPTVSCDGGLLGAAARGDASVFSEFGQQVQRRGFALADLGAPDCLWPAVVNEGRQLWSSMAPGIITSHEGVTTHGKDPSGNARGDKYITASCAAVHGSHPALEALDTALACVGTALNEHAFGGALVVRSDPFFACFPGGGAQCK